MQPTGQSQHQLDKLAQAADQRSYFVPSHRLCRTHSGPQARQLGIYHLASLLIKSYFTLSRPSLSTNLIRALDNATNRQPLSSYPKAEQVTWRFLMGTLALLDGKWAKARDELDSAWATCHWKAERNLRQILTLLIPINLLLGLLPSDAVMREHPLLARLYGPFVEAVRKSDLYGYDKALEGAMEWAVDKKVWAALERGREVVVRGALRKTSASSPLSDLPGHHGDIETDATPFSPFSTMTRNQLARTRQTSPSQGLRVPSRAAHLLSSAVVRPSSVSRGRGLSHDGRERDGVDRGGRVSAGGHDLQGASSPYLSPMFSSRSDSFRTHPFLLVVHTVS